MLGISFIYYLARPTDLQISRVPQCSFRGPDLTIKRSSIQSSPAGPGIAKHASSDPCPVHSGVAKLSLLNSNKDCFAALLGGKVTRLKKPI